MNLSGPGFRIFGAVFDLEGKAQKLKELEHRMVQSNFWSDPQSAQHTLKKRTAIEKQVNRWKEIEQEFEEAEVCMTLGQEEDEPDLLREAESRFAQIETSLRTLQLEYTLQGPDDLQNAFLVIHAGAGGTEAQDWAEMLLRMYLRWAEKREFHTEMYDLLPGEEAGLKSATVLIKGTYAYGFLRSEIGIHRLIRISPFDAGARRHTSFSSVFVYPEPTEDTEIEIKEEDLKVDTFRASGAGGQHVNKTDSAVRMTHVPTGITVQCQSERSQHKNRSRALKILKARLLEVRRQEEAQKQSDIYKEQKEIAWGHQIRSYILQPYRLVKDHRTQYEVGNVDAVLDGELEPFMESFLLKR